MAENHRPDLIFLDINLPGMNEFEALKRLKASEATKNIPEVALTARASGSDREHGLQSGFDYYLTKPFQSEEISTVIQRFLA
ncbi:MAG: response regulator [Proteobacteria bacterium]|nr:response regulator [Pseudomonadota bacterium]